jgi:hypothetical protein
MVEKVDLVIILVKLSKVLILVLKVIHLVKGIHLFFDYLLELEDFEGFNRLFYKVFVSNVPVLDIPDLENQ